MKIIRFLGGLGNQMFQYAFYKALSQQHPKVYADVNGYKNYALHNGFELEYVFDLEVVKASEFRSKLYDIHNRKWMYRKFRNFLNLTQAYEEEQTPFAYDPKVFAEQFDKYYWGYWQNPLYFTHVAEELRNDFRFKHPLDSKNQMIMDQIKGNMSVALHVRRGDYMKDPVLGGLCPESYYQKAIQLLLTKQPAAKFFVFSDDIEWCKETFKMEGTAFISWNTGIASYIDMQLMSNCKHNIIANSSFSWWGAWLNNNPDKILIGPEKWVNDPYLNTTGLFPKDWIAL